MQDAALTELARFGPPKNQNGGADHGNRLIAATAVVGNVTSALLEKIKTALTHRLLRRAQGLAALDEHDGRDRVCQDALEDHDDIVAGRPGAGARPAPLSRNAVQGEVAKLAAHLGNLELSGKAVLDRDIARVEQPALSGLDQGKRTGREAGAPARDRPERPGEAQERLQVAGATAEGAWRRLRQTGNRNTPINLQTLVVSEGRAGGRSRFATRMILQKVQEAKASFGGAIIMNGMWRTGSTYLGHVFTRAGKYKMFYEPCHEDAGAQSAILAVQRDYQKKLVDLRHPKMEAAYFDVYLEKSPLNEKPLFSLHPKRMAIWDVYRGGSQSSVDFLRHCCALSQAEGKFPFFEFCRSGTQHEMFDTVAKQEGATILHLWRDPVEQFASYDWRGNDYFIPDTIAQLLCSKDYRDLARDIIGAPFRRESLLIQYYARTKPGSAIRRALRLVPVLTPEKCYALFYLSWCISMISGQRTAETSFSLRQLAENPRLRQELEFRHKIDLSDLNCPPRPAEMPFDRARVERWIQRELGASGLA